MKRVCSQMGRVVALAVLLCGAVSGQTFEGAVRPFVAKNCYACHNAKLKSGELDLQAFQDTASFVKGRDTWERIVQKVRTGEMPPKGLPRPSAAEIASVTNWIENYFDQLDRSAKPDPGRVTARRLNRFEYNNTIRDLTGVTFRPADDFPADDAGYGFDNIGDVLSLSPVLMEKYLRASEKIAKAAIMVERKPMKAVRARYQSEPAKVKKQSKEFGPEPTTAAFHVQHRFPATGEYEIRLALTGPRPYIPDDEPMKLALYLDGNVRKEFDVPTDPDKPRQFELKLVVQAGLHTLGGAILTDPMGAVVDSIELRGPYNPELPALTQSHKRIMICGHDIGHHDATCARKIVSALARRAYRRPVSDDEINGLLKFVDMAQKDTGSLEQGIRVALEAILVSPRFLFRIERDPNPDDPTTAHRISDFELASRLSYFLWSSMPDDQLLRLAEQNQLHETPVLEAQVRRMMLDRKSGALVENFAGQWLELRNLDSMKPDPDRFPQFDSELRTSMKKETQLFFQSIVRDDRSILDFIDGGYSYLNERLADFYGIKGVEGPEFRRVSLDGSSRSGVLTQGSILTITSYPTRTSPVLRGKYVLENFLNAPPPPPPPGVPNLNESAVGKSMSLRQQLEAHRASPMCSSCHQRMDPIGFGLENYSPIGEWRDKDGNFPVDAAGTLPNGKSFQNAAGLKEILKGDRDAFTQCLTEKMLTYALGRGLERYDKQAVKSISDSVAANSYRFSALVLGIVESMPFEMRRGDSPVKVTEAPVVKTGS